MDIVTKKMADEYIKEICSWDYDGRYKLYNLISYDEMKKKGSVFFDVQNFDCDCYFDGDVIIGYTKKTEVGGETCVSIGVNPNLLGRGYGKKILSIAVGEIKRMNPNKPVYLNVRTWNERAINCYTGAGFRIVGEPRIVERLSKDELFYKMEYQGK